MAEELQSLLDRIQSEGVAKAEARAAEIVAEAEKKAAGIVAEAEKRAAEIRAAAEADAATLQSRAEQSLQQAARDVRLQVGAAIQDTLERVLLKDVRAALADPAFLQRYVEMAAKSVGGAAELRVPEDQAEALSEYARSRLADEVGKGLKIAPDSDVTAGVRVLLDGGRVEHDFTDEAVMEALSRVVRPSLAKLAFGK